MVHEHPGPGYRGARVPPPPPGSCPQLEKLSLLVQGLLSEEERVMLENHLAICKHCEVEVTRIVDEAQALIRDRRGRRFPWVPTIASITVLAACAIAYFLSGGGKYLELFEPARLLTFEGSLELGRGKTRMDLDPAIGLYLNRGDRVRTPDKDAKAYFISTTGTLYRYDSRGETLLARLGPGVAPPGVTKRRTRLREIAEETDENSPPGKWIRAHAPRGNILSQKPFFELSGSMKSQEPVPIEIREEESRIRLRWSGRGTRISFPATGRPLERGRTFFWKAEGMQDEQAFYIASKREFDEWNTFRATLEGTQIPSIAVLILEVRYLLNRGYHLDALTRIEELCKICPGAVWPVEETALVLDRLGRTRQARRCLERAWGELGTDSDT